MKKVLVINSGSSSIKYQLFEMSDKTVLARGLLEQIGEPLSCLRHQSPNARGDKVKITRTLPVDNHRQGLQLIGDALSESGTLGDSRELFGIGHRVVHGGEAFREPALIDEKVISAIRALSPLAPLHNPANLMGIQVALQFAPDVPQIAVFDTAFHQSVPPQAFHYALPHDFYDNHKVRRYGFHGTSHNYVAKQAALYLKKALDTLNLITLHLGNGASVTAIEKGKSVDTSMGMTPLEGLIMGTRSGDIDPAIIFYLVRKTGLSNDEMESLLNKHSGLKGICGVNDMREIARLAAEGNGQARLAIEMYCYRIKKYIGAYKAVLGDVDALVFTGGIGENAADIRARSCDGLSGMGIEVDEIKNNLKASFVREIQRNNGSVRILVIPTDEELEIAEQTVAKIKSMP
jgi:acetate kinase